MARFDSTIRTLGTVALLGAALPFTLGLVALSQVGVWRGERDGRASQSGASYPVGGRKTILISGAKMTKALVLARAFHRAGHRVILCESHRYAMAAHQYSNAVDIFETLPDTGSADYAEALKHLIRRHGVDIYVPVTSPAGSLHDSALVPDLNADCEVLHVGPDLIAALDDKAQFANAAAKAGLKTPETVRVTSVEEVLDFDFASRKRAFILKSIAYDPVGRLDLTRLPMKDRGAMADYVASLEIGEDNPFVLQEFIPGTEFCTHGFFRDGELRVHCCCASSAFQVNYDHVEKPGIRTWVETFGRANGLTGQASFDFIEAEDDGDIYAIECNPRTHSAITLFADDDRLAESYLDPQSGRDAIEPPRDTRPTYWIAHEVARLFAALPSLNAVNDRLSIIARGRDAALDPRDPLPFLALHHLHIPILLLRAWADGREWYRIDFNIGKLVMAGGD